MLTRTSLPPPLMLASALTREEARVDIDARELDREAVAVAGKADTERKVASSAVVAAEASQEEE